MSKTQTQPNQLTIANIGPIERLAIPVPSEGGVIVLRGPNGAGKTTAIEAADSLMKGTGTLSRRDGQLSPGQVEGFGATIKVGARTTRTGELEVVSLGDRLNIADLVDPQVKDPAAADAKRIKALVSLTGVKADVALFDVDPNSEAARRVAGIADPVEMAALLKRAIEADARAAESKADTADGKAQAAAEIPAGLDMEAESDDAKLQAAVRQAVKDHAQIVGKRDAAREASNRAESARRMLATAEGNYGGPTVEEAEKALQAASDAHVAAVDKVVALRKQLAAAEAEAHKVHDKFEAASSVFRSATAHVAQMQQWRDSLDAAANVEGPADEAVDAAEAAITDAEAAAERGTLIRSIRQRQADAKAHNDAAAHYRDHAAALRKAAAGVDAALSRAVASESLRVVDGRLVTTTKRGDTYYADLSEGERWRVALDIAIEAVGERGVITIPQDAWEGLDPKNRAAVAQHLKGRKVTAITAEAADGELRAEAYDAA
jgi:energy-coupling factor transporter ATP-binding protein EcfA2